MLPALLLPPNPHNIALPSLLRPRLSRLVQALRKLALRSDLRTLPVHDVDGDRHQHCQTSEQCGRILHRPAGDVLVQRCRIERGDAGHEVPRQVVAARG